MNSWSKGGFRMGRFSQGSIPFNAHTPPQLVSAAEELRHRLEELCARRDILVEDSRLLDPDDPMFYVHWGADPPRDVQGEPYTAQSIADAIETLDAEITACAAEIENHRAFDAAVRTTGATAEGQMVLNGFFVANSAE